MLLTPITHPLNTSIIHIHTLRHYSGTSNTSDSWRFPAPKSSLMDCLLRFRRRVFFCADDSVEVSPPLLFLMSSLSELLPRILAALTPALATPFTLLFDPFELTLLAYNSTAPQTAATARVMQSTTCTTHHTHALTALQSAYPLCHSPASSTQRLIKPRLPEKSPMTLRTVTSLRPGSKGLLGIPCACAAGQRRASHFGSAEVWLMKWYTSQPS